MLDGQTIVLDDYLEVRPEQEERLKKYIRSGRIQIGPWYVQPDEFLVSGESLIRNLQLGLRQAADFGALMRVGYVPDCFGHIAQLPQILRGFGIENAVFWRGVGAEAHKSEFFWAAPDGTQVLVIFLAGAMGYSNAANLPLDPEEFAARVEFLAAPLLPMATTNTLLFMNGSDHLEPQDGLPETIEAANKLLAHIMATLSIMDWRSILTAFMCVSARYHSILRLFSSRSNVHQAHPYRLSAARCAVASTRICFLLSSRHVCGLNSRILQWNTCWSDG
jgi:alpha-mannosidase